MKMKKTLICFVLLIFGLSVNLSAQNWCLSFDGDNDYAQTTYGDEVKTLEFWFKTNSFDTFDGLFGQRYDDQEESGNWQMHWHDEGSNNRLRIYCYDPSGGEIVTTTSFETGQWYHVAVTSEVDNVNYYINGVHDSQHTWMSTVFGGGGNDDDLTIGGSFGNSTLYPFDGELDEVRVWSDVRTQTEIQDNMYNEFTGSEDNLVAYYKLNEGSGQTAYDSAGSNNGILGTTSGSDSADPTWVLSDSPLPVNLSSFYALYANGTPTLYWTTQSEENNEYWNVYRGTSDSFTEASQNNDQPIPGNGTTNIPSDYIYTDNSPVVQNATYWYWIEDVSSDGETELHDPITLTIPFDDAPITPENYGLHQNYPNPFNPSTAISFALDEDSDVEVTIYNVKGEKVKTIFSGHVYADQLNSVVWNGKDADGKQVSSGVYLYKLKTGAREYRKKMLLVK